MTTNSSGIISKYGVQDGLGRVDSRWEMNVNETRLGRYTDTYVYYDQYGNKLVEQEGHEDDDWYGY